MTFQPPPTQRLYLQDETLFETDALVVAVRAQALACDRTCFYPGGGGQPPDQGALHLPDGRALEVLTVEADADGLLWHVLNAPPPADLLGQTIRLQLDAPRRLALMRYHTVLHVLNTLALREYNGWITGVQIGPDHSRIDFKLEDFSPALAADLERRVNTVLGEAHPIQAYDVSEEEFNRRGDLLRTLEVRPPIKDGRVRVVEIVGFDAQACGGTHVHSTAEVGKLSIYKIENKGRINKRLYVRLDNPD